MRKDSIVILVILFLFGAWVMLSDFSHQTTSNDVEVSPRKVTEKDINELVNKHLNLTGQQQDLHERSQQAKNRAIAPKIGDKILIPASKKVGTQFGLDSDANESNAINDLQKDRRELEVYKPSNEIQSQLADEQIKQRYEAAYQEAYIKQFIENARQGGYEVQINDRNEVISVRPIRQPTGNLPAAQSHEGKPVQ